MGNAVNMIDNRSLQLLIKNLIKPEYKRAFIVAIMDDGDYTELKKLYQELDAKDREIENNLYNIIYASKEKERKTPVKAEEKVMQSIERINLFGLNLETMFNNYMHTSSLKECERRVPILRQERKVILDEIDKLYDSYEEIYNKKVKSKEIKNLFVGAFGNKIEDMDENFLEWIIGLRN